MPSGIIKEVKMIKIKKEKLENNSATKQMFKDLKEEELVEDMKKNFKKVWGMTYEEYEEKLNSPFMRAFVKEARKRF